MANGARHGALWLLCVLLLLLSVSCGGDDDDDDAADAADDDMIADDDTSDSDDDDDTPFDDDDDDDTSPPSDDDTDDQLDPPAQRGPYDVGVTTLCFTDESRWELWGLRDRFLPLEIWYPSTGEGGQINSLEDMIGPIPFWGEWVFELLYGDAFADLLAYETTALRDAEILVGDTPYPVVFFSHGLNAIRFQNFTTCEHLASHGFIVVAPDHYGNAIFTNDPEGGALVLADPLTIVDSYFDRVEDVEFIYRRLEELNAEQGGPWENLMNLDAFGITGHSYGGMTTLQSGAAFDFVDAIAPLNPAWVGIFPREFTKPFFLLQGQIDNIVGLFNDPVRELWNEAESSDKVFVDLIKGGHYSATDACLLLPPGLFPDSITGCGGTQFITSDAANEILNGYLTSFFKSSLLGDERYDEYLSTNQYPADIELTSSWAQ